MKRILPALSALLILLSLGAACYAHGNEKHVQGTVARFTADAIVVKTADGSETVAKTTPATLYVQREGGADKPAKRADLAVGDRVLIHATPKGAELIATKVKFSHASAAQAAKPAKPEH